MTGGSTTSKARTKTNTNKSLVRAFAVFFFLLLGYGSLNAQNLDFAWAKGIGGSGAESGYSAIIDASGNVYTTGTFSGTTDFDPNAGVANLTSVGVNSDIFVSKLDASGNFVWAKAMGGTSFSTANSIAIDATGNVYTTGYFSGTADFDPSAGVANLTSAGGDDVFVSKLDASGNFVWAKGMGGSGAESGYSATIDASGNVYTTGYFSGTVDFDPNASVANLASAGGSQDIFVSKLNASGNFVWAKAMGGTDYDEPNSIAVDATGNVYTAGLFRGTADFDPNAGVANLTSAGGDDVFVSKLDASGNFVWAKAMGGTNSENATSIAIDVTGNVYTTGFFAGTTDFDPNTGVVNLTSAGSLDIFVSKLDASGNFVWAKAMGGGSTGIANSIAVDATGNVYTTGYFFGTTDFDPNTGVVNLTSAGSSDIFVSKLDASGNFVWAKAMGGIGYDESRSIAVDASSNVYTTGNFSNTVDFDPNAGVVNLTASGNTDVFIAKYTQCPTITISPTSLVSGIVGTPYSQTFTATGGTAGATYTFSIPANQLANTGLALSAGVLSGVPTLSASTTLRVTATTTPNNCSGFKDYTIVINPNLATSIDNSLANLVKVFPNPSSGDFNIDFSTINMAKSSVRVYDAQGKVVFSSENNSNLMTISLDKFANGIYLLEVKTENKRITKRLAKQ